MPAEAFKGHVATDGSLLGIAGQWGACGWSVVQVDLDEVGPFAWDERLDGGRMRGPAHHQHGGADGLLLSYRTHQGACRQR